MQQVAAIGAGMTRFGKHLDRSMKDLAREAVEVALHSAGIEKDAIEAAAVGGVRGHCCKGHWASDVTPCFCC